MHSQTQNFKLKRFRLSLSSEMIIVFFFHKVQTGFVTFDTNVSRAPLARRWDQTLANVASFCFTG